MTRRLAGNLGGEWLEGVEMRTWKGHSVGDPKIVGDGVSDTSMGDNGLAKDTGGQRVVRG
jgi:hypothetical protein